ncbi:glycosyltransferase family protein [Cellulomonas sp. P5_C5]
MSTPVSPVHRARGREEDVARLRLAFQGPLRDEDGVLQYVPRIAVPLTMSSGRSALKRAVAHIGFRDADVLLVDQPLMAAATSAAPTAKLVYRPTDTYHGDPQLRRQSILRDSADGIVATSQHVLTSLGTIPARVPTLVLPNGVELEPFVAASAEQRTGSVYVGAIDHRFDWDAVVAIANASQQHAVRLAGPVVGPVPRLPDNVELLGAVDYANVPSLLAGARVGLLPFNDSDVNRGRSPMKFYEYCAAGLHIVARSTAELGTRSAHDVATYESPSDAARHVLAALDRAEPSSDNVLAAREQDWSRVAGRLVDFLEGLS